MSEKNDIYADPVLQALIAEAAADADVVGLVLTGSRAIGAMTAELDYDLIFVVTDEACARYGQGRQPPGRGAAIRNADIQTESPGSLQPESVASWMLPAFAEARVLFDRTGETTRLIASLRSMPAELARTAVAGWYDAYLNGLYRSLKSWRRGDELGARMEAAQTADYLLHVLYALERRWRPYSSRLVHHLPVLEAQGWRPGELREILLDLIGSGDPHRQQIIARRVIALLRERGFGHVYDGWDGKIDGVLAWEWP